MKADRPVSVDVFLDEYSRDDVIAKYLNDTAGDGIAYALHHVYGPVYADVVRRLIARRPRGHRFRVLEYGCGGGMNLVKVLDLFRQQGAEIELGVGADFSPRMVEAAREDVVPRLPASLRERVQFAVAANESLARDLAKDLGMPIERLEKSFDVVVGVNTFRYCHRLQKDDECARDIHRLLASGGCSVMIDMNRNFPLFKSRVADLIRRRKPEEAYLPTLAEYTNPFRRAGMTVQTSRNFCWFPHSAGPGLVRALRVAAPVLDLTVSRFAMRSLVVAERPA
jgi:SAM-dependent methyltransferase